MTEEKNSKSESQEEQPKKEWKLDQEQYDRLKKCSRKEPEGIEEWNAWREENPEEEIWLQGANLFKAKLQGVDLCEANLEGANLWNADLQGADLGEANLREAKLRGAKLQKAYLVNTNLQGANLHFANLQRTDLEYANLQGADLHKAKLQGADLSFAHLEFANLSLANLKNANLSHAHLEDAGVIQTNLEGADLRLAKLQGAVFFGAIVNGATFFLFCEVDRDTEFRETGLENACIESGTKQLLKYNERRINWGHWYKEHRFLKWPVRLFWSISNYGISTLRIIVWFFGLALFFAGLYYILSVVSPPGVVNSLVEGKEGSVPGWLIPFRSIYFSIVTMTTLGFGDMHANCRSFLGHLLLTIQVILGYALLGALVTRLAVLFTSDGPAGSYTPMDKETKELLAKLKEDKEKAG